MAEGLGKGAEATDKSMESSDLYFKLFLTDFDR